jgi:hypothetical protein
MIQTIGKRIIPINIQTLTLDVKDVYAVVGIYHGIVLEVEGFDICEQCASE